MRRAGGWLAAALLPLAVAAAPPAPERVALCDGCHGPGGNSVTPGTPSIAGQPKLFLENQLVYFREGLRASEVMTPLLEGVTDPQIIALARHYAAQPLRPAASGRADAALVARGRALSERMHCGQCHLPDYRGRDQMPRLAGQREDYLLASMRAYRDNKRTGADTTMAGILDGIPDADLAALAHYLARR